MARSLQDQLDALDALIAQYEAEPMEEFSVKEREYRRARLADLYRERRALTAEVQAESGSKFLLAEPFEQ